MIELEEPDRTPLRQPPLGLVVFQANFSEIERRLASKDIFRCRDALNRGGEGGYGELTQVRKNELTLQLGVFAAASTSSANASVGWRLATRDQAWALIIFPDSIALECRKYEGWAESFQPRLRNALDAAIGAFSPEIETRLGLRYVNQFTSPDATSPAYWLDKIQSPFLGPLQGKLGSAVLNATSRVTFTFDEIEAVVALAFQPDAMRPGTTAAIFDIDIFRQGAREFEFNQLVDAADLLNTRALQVFQNIVTPEYRRTLG